MSQMREIEILRGKRAAPAKCTVTISGKQYKKLLEIKYSRLERINFESTSFCGILSEAVDLLHASESAAGKITVRVKEVRKDEEK